MKNLLFGFQRLYEPQVKFRKLFIERNFLHNMWINDMVMWKTQKLFIELDKFVTRILRFISNL